MTTRRENNPRPPLAALLIDISGTLHVGSTPTPNAVNAFHRLRKSQVPFRLCSNTSKESTAALVKRLEAMGFGGLHPQGTQLVEGTESGASPPSRRLVWTSIGAVAQTITKSGLKSPFLLRTDSAREEVLSGMKIHDGSSRQTSQDIYDKPPSYDSVVIGLSPSSFNYPTLNTAFRILKGEPIDKSSSDVPKELSSAPPPLIVTHKAKYFQTESGLSLGPGPFVVALENASGVKAHVVGKPTKEFFQMVIDDFTAEELPTPASAEHDDASPRIVGLGTKPKERPPTSKGRIAVIGDDVEADLGGGAVELGLWRILVKTGKYRAGDEKRPGVVPPDEIFDSFADFIDSLLSDRISKL
ncbi:hypothetical protein M413DRAFT_444307 [Hebeloma cylindrosporum]|uniref:Uncharacterized protein n=1 Tax=Hebeloma cylindrosporum TaxID=76867 RepID=A0A0C2YNN7_HEBCY|nr:hypothetical protein M413DRAFT_444307 [Hebeloma cylindrosporum h7]